MQIGGRYFLANFFNDDYQFNEADYEMQACSKATGQSQLGSASILLAVRMTARLFSTADSGSAPASSKGLTFCELKSKI
ncbi:MAG: hypothetical protein ONA90_06605 [candidate division KSB1 bacterium]|nr:hypothetical protein [candidate division KSB1 bacterium]